MTRDSCKVILSVACAFVGSLGASGRAQNYALDWFSIAGSSSVSAGGSYSLSITVGQPGAGPRMANGPYAVSGGFWSVSVVPVVAPPLLPTQSDWIIDVLTTLIATNAATLQQGAGIGVTYQLLTAPEGATISPAGVITWTPTQAQGPSTNVFTTIAKETGTPSLSSTNSFSTIVRGLYSEIDLTNSTSALASPGGDGLSNLLKYALGLDPAAFGTEPAVLLCSRATSDSGDFLTLSFHRRRNTPWLQYIPEVSGDNQTWYSDAAHVKSIGAAQLDDQFDAVIVQDLTSARSPAPRFIRLRVVSSLP